MGSSSSLSRLRSGRRSVGDTGPGVLERLVERLDVAAAEGQRALPLDQLEEEGAPLVGRAGEDLEHLAPPVAVGEDVGLAQLLQRDRQLAQAALERVVVAPGRD